MSEDEIRNAVIKFDREDLLYGDYETDIDTPIEVFLTIRQMSKFIKQQEEIQWYEKENKYNQEIIIKQEQELQQKENIIKEAREKLNTQLAFTSSYQLNYQSAMSIIEEAKSILQGVDKN